MELVPVTPYWENGVTRLYQADARALPLPDESVHCVVTSPPYWGLRNYKLEPQVWGGSSGCAHTWDHELLETETGGGDWAQAVNGRGEIQPGGLEAKREAVPGRAATASCEGCGAWLGTLGFEPTVELYIAHLVEVFREVRRVLRKDGVCWLNIGDSYYSAAGKGGSRGTRAGDPKSPRGRDGELDGPNRSPQPGFKPGDRMGIPERLVLALQEDGWTWRDTDIWVKTAPMPESVRGTRWERCRRKVSSGAVAHHGMERGVSHVNESDLSGRRSQKNDGHIDRRKVGIDDRTQPEPWRAGANPKKPQMGHDGPDFAPRAKWEDCPGCEKCEPNGGYVLRQGSWRCTAAHEYIYMLTKGMAYYSDGEPLRTPLRKGTFLRVNQNGGNPIWNVDRDRQSTQSTPTLDMEHMAPAEGANRRSVWSDISPEPYPGPHYAVFPSDLPRLCILASTSEEGVCPKCGAQWARVVERRPASMNIRVREARNGNRADKSWAHRDATDEEMAEYSVESMGSSRTTDWRPTCRCDTVDPVPALVLDPFAGTATTCIAAQRLGRRSVGVDLSGHYLDQAVQRISGVPLPLGAE